MKICKKTLGIIVLSFFLIFALGYIGISKYNSYNQEKDLGIFQQGSQYGYEQAIVQIAQMATTCKQVPLRVENQTMNMIAVDCLNQGVGQ